MGLGPVHTVTLADARHAAQEARRLLLEGHDPIEARRTIRARHALAGAKALTFREAAETYIAAHAGTWKNRVHAAQWPASLEAYAYPVLGRLPVASIETSHVLAAMGADVTAVEIDPAMRRLIYDGADAPLLARHAFLTAPNFAAAARAMAREGRVAPEDAVRISRG